MTIPNQESGRERTQPRPGSVSLKRKTKKGKYDLLKAEIRYIVNGGTKGFGAETLTPD